MTKEGSAKIVNCICHYSEYDFSSYLSIYFTLSYIVLKDYDAAFLCIYYNNGAADMQIYALLTLILR